MMGSYSSSMCGNSEFHRGNASMGKEQSSGGNTRGLDVAGRQPNGTGKDGQKTRKGRRNRNGGRRAGLSAFLPPHSENPPTGTPCLFVDWGESSEGCRSLHGEGKFLRKGMMEGGSVIWRLHVALKILHLRSTVAGCPCRQLKHPPEMVECSRFQQNPPN